MINKNHFIQEIEDRFKPRYGGTHDILLIRHYYSMCLKYDLRPLGEMSKVHATEEEFYHDCLDSMKEKRPDYLPPHKRRNDVHLFHHLRELLIEHFTLQMNSQLNSEPNAE